jgi:hypothetical protein
MLLLDIQLEVERLEALEREMDTSHSHNGGRGALRPLR